MGNNRSNAYKSIRERIISLHYMPGANLDEHSLVKELGLSRTPVREALIRLSAEGLVELEMNKGARVSDLDVFTLTSIFEAGDLVEKAIIRLVCLRRSEAEIVKLQDASDQFDIALKNNDVQEMVKANTAFHLLLAEASKNKYLIRSYRQILADHERIAQMWYSHNIAADNPQDNQTMSEHHHSLLSAVRAQDMVEAERITRAHASHCMNGIKQLLSGGIDVIEDLQISIDQTLDR